MELLQARDDQQVVTAIESGTYLFRSSGGVVEVELDKDTPTLLPVGWEALRHHGLRRLPGGLGYLPRRQRIRSSR